MRTIRYECEDNTLMVKIRNSPATAHSRGKAGEEPMPNQAQTSSLSLIVRQIERPRKRRV
jgi:hypothetical protein